MKRTIFLLTLLSFIAFTANSQVVVSSFDEDAADQDARIARTGESLLKDSNDKYCALVKISTKGISQIQREKFRIAYGDAATQIKKVDFPTGEIWFWVSPIKGSIIIKHPDFGNQPYSFPVALKAKTVYRMTIELASVNMTVRATPDDAKIYIDGEYIAQGEATKKVTMDTEHEYRVECEDYFEEKKVVKAGYDGQNVFEVKLKPAFGYIDIKTTPVVGAKVYIDDKEAGTTPFFKKYPRGEYVIRVTKDLYLDYNDAISVGDGKKTELNVTLQENFARPIIKTSYDAEIWLDGGSGFEKKGVGEWTGTVAPGYYTVEARKDGCRSTRQYVTLTNGQQTTITLEAPKAVLGNLRVESSPAGATISLNNSPKGVTPYTINSLPVGEYSVVLTKDGYGTAMQTVTVLENQTVNVNLTLVNGKSITISSEPSGAAVYVDGNYLGTTPLTKQLTYGSHNVKVSNDGEEKTQSINVSEYGNSSWSFDVRKKPKGTYTVNGVSFEMVAVEGGTFTMGCTSEQGSDCYDWEKPSHRVALSNYMIGKYEVTQELWQAVMSSNPSNFKGNKNPVESVSWNDVQEFITKLNQLTGQNFRLPTEAEWEFAARGGNKSNGYKYSGSNTIGNVAWFTDNSGSATHPVGTKSPNELGIYDMSGNVYEWCQDWYGSYSSSSETNPKGPSSGSYRVLRGGSWIYGAKYCRVSYRFNFNPDFRYFSYGFRLALSR